MNTFQNKYDAIEQIIFENGLRMLGIHFYPQIDLMLVVLNNKKILKRTISATSPILAKASEEQLNHFQWMGDGVAIHWPDLDEDLSLKGFLQDELSKLEVQALV